MKNIACAFGWGNSYAHQYAAEQQPMVGLRPVDSTPALLATSLPNYAVREGLIKLMLNRHVSGLVRNAAYDVSQWPIIMLPALPFVKELEKEGEPISAAAIKVIAEKRFVSDNELDAVLTPVLKAAVPLSGSARKDMYRFVSVCAGLLEGGLPVAVDWAILLWVVPALENGSKQYHAVKEVLNEYPLSIAKL